MVKGGERGVSSHVDGSSVRIDSGERLLICGDLNGHVGSEIDGFEGVHGGFGFGKQNVEGEMILETADALNLAVLNTWFKKKERRLFTYIYVLLH